MKHDSSQDGAVALTAPPLANGELKELFDAAWPDHRPTAFTPALARSLALRLSTVVDPE
jgi:hypothetical protein